jgi:L-lactate dehydrogenase complex protein LldG
MNSREEVLGRIRNALQDRPEPAAVVRSYRGAGARPTSLPLFVERVEDYQAAVHRCTNDDLPALLAHLLPDSVVVADGFPPLWLAQVVHAIRDEPPLDVRALDQVDSVLTTCAVAVAETGTVVLDAGPGQGRRVLSLVPDHHVVVVREADVVADVPDALRHLDPLRPQTWISGPSATSDIELDRVEGVHGPRRLDVVLVATLPDQPY